MRRDLASVARLACVPALAGLVGGEVRAQTAPPPRGAETAPDAIRPLLGAWDLELVGASRKCTITLGAEAAAQGRQVRFPATCRRALPLLDQVAAWSVSRTGTPRLDDALGKTIVAFAETGADKALEGKGPDGKPYRLDSKDHPRAARRAVQRPVETAAKSAQRPTLVDPRSAPPPETLPGRYVLMRQQNREACRLVLAGPVSPTGSGTASFDGMCQDTGLAIFDPTGWRYAGGRLTLVARKGHVTELVFESGQWRKDPPVGAPLMMRRLGN